MQLKFESKSNDNIKESFDVFYSKIRTSQPILYPNHYLQARPSIAQWLKDIEINFSLSNETLFTSIDLLDTYIGNQCYCLLNLDLYLTAIACLSLSIKQNEINANYTAFLTHCILNQLPSLHYTTKDLSIQEFKVLKALGFKINNSNAYHFSLLFLQICFNHCTEVNCFDLLYLLNENNLKQFMTMEIYLCINPIAMAYYSVKMSLKQMSNKSNNINVIDIQRIKREIKGLLREKNIIPLKDDNDNNTKEDSSSSVVIHNQVKVNLNLNVDIMSS